MKKNLAINYSFVSILFLLLLTNKVSSQNTGAGQAQAPPTRTVSFGYNSQLFRGLFVDCADVIIADLAQSIPNNHKEIELKDYIFANDINYIALYGLDNSNVIGNPQLEPVLMSFIA